MNLSISKADFEVLLEKLKNDADMQDVYKGLLVSKERSLSNKKSRMKIVSMDKLKQESSFNVNHKIIENGETTAVSLKLLLAIWENKGCKLYGSYNDVFLVLRSNDVIEYVDIDGEYFNVPTTQFDSSIIKRDYCIGNKKCIKLFFTKEASKIIKGVLINEGILEEGDIK